MLAGGAGRRLGGGKAAVELAGRGLVEYPLAALAAAGVEAVVVAKGDTELPALAVPVVVEPEEPRHPLLGIVTALRHAGGRPVLVVACDLPLLTPALLAALAASPPTADAASLAASPQPPDPPPLASSPQPPDPPLVPAPQPSDLPPLASSSQLPDPPPPASPQPPDPPALAATTPGVEPLVLAAPGGEPQPLLGRYPPALLPELERALERREPLRRTVAALSPQLLGDAELAAFGDPAELLLNVNDPADLERAAAILAAR